MRMQRAAHLVHVFAVFANSKRLCSDGQGCSTPGHISGILRMRLKRYISGANCKVSDLS